MKSQAPQPKAVLIGPWMHALVFALLALLAAGCSAPASTPAPTPAATLLPPSPVPTASATAGPLDPTVLLRVPLPYPDAPGYALVVDPTVWTVNPQVKYGQQLLLLMNRAQPGCTIDLIAPLQGESAATQAPPSERVIGPYLWRIAADGHRYTLAGDPKFPGLALLNQSEDESCRQAQEQALSLLSGAKIVAIPAATATRPPAPPANPNPALPKCYNAAEIRLMVGMGADVIYEVSLRSSPEKREDNVLDILPRGLVLSVLEGPKCAEFEGGSYYYWKISYHDKVKGTVTGWAAEGTPTYYFLQPHK